MSNPHVTLTQSTAHHTCKLIQVDGELAGQITYNTTTRRWAARTTSRSIGYGYTKEQAKVKVAEQWKLEQA